MNIWNNPVLEELRDSRRKKSGRIAYDCFKLIAEDGDKVYCTEGNHLTVNLLGILAGVTPGVCKECQDYDGGEDER